MTEEQEIKELELMYEMPSQAEEVKDAIGVLVALIMIVGVFIYLELR